MLRENERLEDLKYNGLEIIQSDNLYRFTSDAVLLANAVKARRIDRVCDLGSGSGIISILIAAKRGARVVGVEIQKELCDMARRSVAHNGLESVVEIFDCRIQDAEKTFGGGRFDIAVCNPPYGKKSDAKGINGQSDIIARTEAEITLSEVVTCASKLLRFGGKFYIIIKTFRLFEAMKYMCDCKIEPKELTLVIPTRGKAPDTAIICGARGGKSGLKVEKPIYADECEFVQKQ
ncbi:MAG: methyltransferase [Clostridiales bacterium]|jgi:tRNA1Val (adenine37-N6)-methyltransferase|nr:methyltransferase [Clostridiales bacterium]